MGFEEFICFIKFQTQMDDQYFSIQEAIKQSLFLQEMPVKAVDGTIAYASDTWRLKIIYIDMYFQSPGVTSIDFIVLAMD